MQFEDLTPEQQEKAKACGSAEELLKFAKEEGLPLSDAELEGVVGGKFGEGWLCHEVCPDHTGCTTNVK